MWRKILYNTTKKGSFLQVSNFPVCLMFIIVCVDVTLISTAQNQDENGLLLIVRTCSDKCRNFPCARREG